MAYFLALRYANNQYIYLDGAGITAPVKGCQYSPGRGKIGVLDGQEVITEELKIDLSGTYRQISDFISTLNTHLEIEKAGAWRYQPNGSLWLVLKEPDEAGAFFWYAYIQDARLELDPAGLAQRKSGQQSVSLFLTRFNRWESSNTRTAMTINLPGGGIQDTYGGMANHKDATAGDSNWGFINPASMAGDLKSHASFQFVPGAGDFVGDVLMGVSYADVGSPNVQYALPTLEETAFSAAGGVTKTSYGSGACSGGKLCHFCMEHGCRDPFNDRGHSNQHAVSLPGLRAAI